MTTAERVAVVIARESAERPIAWTDLRAMFPGIADTTIDRALAMLLGEGYLERVERVPRVRYGWTGALLPSSLDVAAEQVDKGVRISPRILGAELRQVLADRDRPIEEVAKEHNTTVATIRRIWEGSR